MLKRDGSGKIICSNCSEEHYMPELLEVPPSLERYRLLQPLYLLQAYTSGDPAEAEQLVLPTPITVVSCHRPFLNGYGKAGDGAFESLFSTCVFIADPGGGGLEQTLVFCT